MPVIEEVGLRGLVGSPLAVRDDSTDSEGDQTLLAALRCDLRTGQVSWTIFRQPGTQYAVGAHAGYSEVRALLSGSDADHLDDLRATYTELFKAVGVDVAHL